MSNSLKDQLMGLGFKNSPTKPVETKPKANHKKPDYKKPDYKKSVTPSKVPVNNTSEFDLAKAFALRQKDEQRLRDQAETEKQEQARLRRVVKEQVGLLLKDHVLNSPEADIARHFPYSGKIKRVYVTAQQLRAINAGELSVVQHLGKFCIVNTALALQVQALIPALLALHCDGTEQAVGDEYADPQFTVPDDLIW
jgi:uncharacterized protein YaiL (DUF2058 family)